MKDLMHTFFTKLFRNTPTRSTANTGKSSIEKIVASTRKAMLPVALGGATAFAPILIQAAETTIPVDLAGTAATKHEIAVLQVLSEICPPMLNNQQKSNFYKAYNYELKQLLPTIENPKAAIQYLSTQQDYKVILSSMRDWTMGFSPEENLALCTDLANTEF